jgi:hypothetical protein
MARYVTPDVEAVRDDPVPGESIALAAVPCESVDTATVESRVGSLGGDVVRTLPSGVVLIEVSQPDVRELCEMDLFESVSGTDRLEVQT